MGEIDDIVRDEQVIHLLEEAEKAMRLVAQLAPGDKKQVQDALDTLWLDIGRTVYNLYWKEDLEAGEFGAELAQFTSEVPTAEISRYRNTPAGQMPSVVAPPVHILSENDLPGFSPDYMSKPGESEDNSWYTSEVEIPDRPLFTEADGLKEELP